MIKYKNILIHCSVFLIFFLICFYISSGWNQFYPIGERIRDYALLVEQTKNLFGTNEPWLSGTEVYYYLFWYKIGGFIGKLFHLSGETNYLVLLNVCWTLYFAVIYFFIHKILKKDLLFSILGSLLILFSSNWLGLSFALNSLSKDWWHVSRAIEGAITEFPAWSYLLGDLHPHLMNLCLPPLFLYLIFLLDEFSFKEQMISLSFLGVFFVSLFLNANPWDAICIAVVGTYASLHFYLKRKTAGEKKIPRFFFAGMTFFIFLFLYLKPQMKAHANLRLVMAPVSRTEFSQFLSHWGFWIFLIAISSAFSVYMRTFNDWLKKYWIIAAATLSFWLLPEIVFLDDAYGPPNERMNFIFKIYSFTWVFAGLWFISLIQTLPQFWARGILVVVFIPALLFFHKTYQIRLGELSGVTHPLEIADRNFSGVKNAIEKFREYPDGVTIESVAGAYDYTSFIGTMSNKQLYLGWGNHMALLSGDHINVMMRTSQINALYNEADCETKKQMMQTIGATYIILSTKEYNVYPQINPQSFSCLKPIVDSSNVSIFSL